MVPIRERACAWIDKYLREVRPELQIGADDHTLFLHDDGKPYPPGRFGDLVKRHLEHAGIRHAGACHLFRHAMATHMLENGADIRYIQLILGHADLATTQIYTQVSLDKLKEIHAATYPAKLARASAVHGTITKSDADVLLATLDAEARDDLDEEATWPPVTQLAGVALRSCCASHSPAWQSRCRGQRKLRARLRQGALIKGASGGHRT